MYVARRASGRLTTVEGRAVDAGARRVSRTARRHARAGWRAEINLRAVEWIRDAGAPAASGLRDPDRLRPRGARALFRRARRRHADLVRAAHDGRARNGSGPRRRGSQRPGEQDITAHVDFTSVRAAAEAEGLITLGFMDQTYFVLAILLGRDALGSATGEPQREPRAENAVMPGGLGSTHKVLILGKGVGRPALLGCSFRQRVT